MIAPNVDRFEIEFRTKRAFYISTIASNEKRRQKKKRETTLTFGQANNTTTKLPQPLQAAMPELERIFSTVPMTEFGFGDWPDANIRES